MKKENCFWELFIMIGVAVILTMFQLKVFFYLIDR